MALKFLVSGMMGDFIHSMSVVKNLSTLHGKPAKVFLTNGHQGDIWRFGVDKAYEDLKGLVLLQPYIDEFSILPNDEDVTDFINLNRWRITVAKTHAETGRYNICWTELLSKEFGYIPQEYQWLSNDSKKENIIVVHRSHRHQNSNIFWERMFNRYKNEKILFVTSNPQEYQDFFLRDKSQFIQTDTVSEMASVIGSAKLFIGNQSAPFAISCGLDIPRICELDFDPSPFYIGEEKYSQNHQWWLNDKTQNCSKFKNI